MTRRQASKSKVSGPPVEGHMFSVGGHVHNDSADRGSTPLPAEANGVPTAGCRDRVVLVVAALAVCAAGVGSFWFAEEYRINPAWFFFTWNSILLIPMFARRFRAQFKRLSFIVFFAVWMCVHGGVILALMRWVSIVYWPIFVLLEFAAGFIAAHSLFGVPFDRVPDGRGVKR